MAVKGIALRILSWTESRLVTPIMGFWIGSKRNEFEKRNKSMNLYIFQKGVCMYLYVFMHVCGFYTSEFKGPLLALSLNLG